MKDKSAKWVIGFLISFVTTLVILGGITAIIDPFFHYHRPLSFVRYELRDERYQNNGIVKHFDYDAIITGSSMAECFRPSELNALFGVNAVKVPYSGGSYKEVNDNLYIATQYNSDIKMIVRCLDANRFFDDKDQMDYTYYPDYLYDSSIWNDAGYLLNKSVLVTAIQNLHGYMVTKSTDLSFDDYINWSDYMTYGKAAVDMKYDRTAIEVAEEMLSITEEEYERMEQNIEQNITRLAEENPDVEFYIYFSPYSIYYFDYWHRTGVLEKQLKAERFFIEKLLACDNIHVFSFFTEYDTICNLDNYKDIAHHSGALNSQILEWMKESRGELTYDNYEEYCEEEWDFYMNYDYDALFEKTFLN